MSSETAELINRLLWHAAAMSNAIDHAGPDVDGARLMREAARYIEIMETLCESASKRINDLIENNNEKHQEIIALKAMLAKYGAPIEADSNSITGRAFQNIAGGQGGCLNQALDNEGWTKWADKAPRPNADGSTSGVRLKSSNKKLDGGLWLISTAGRTPPTDIDPDVMWQKLSRG